MRHAFLINPEAGKGREQKTLEREIRRVCEELGVDYSIHQPASARDMTACALELAARAEPCRLYACGGDGTLNRVLAGIVGHTNAELALLPCGTGNDFVRSLGPKDRFLDVAAQIQGQSVPLDVIRMGDAYALNMVNIGVDCDVVVEAARMKTRPLIKGDLAYLLAVIKVLRRGKVYRMLLQVDEEEAREEAFFLIAIANGRFCGGGFQAAPQALPDDGYLDVCAIRPLAGWKLLVLLAKYRRGRHLDDPAFSPYIIYGKCKSVGVDAAEPVCLSVDGEVSDFQRASFEVLPHAVNFSLPKGVILSGR